MALLAEESEEAVAPAVLQIRRQGHLNVHVVVGRKALGDDRDRGAVDAEVLVEQLPQRRRLTGPRDLVHPLHEELKLAAELLDLGIHARHANI